MKLRFVVLSFAISLSLLGLVALYLIISLARIAYYSDGDGLSLQQENTLGADPYDWDYDDDALGDGEEENTYLTLELPGNNLE